MKKLLLISTIVFSQAALFATPDSYDGYCDSNNFTSIEQQENKLDRNPSPEQYPDVIEMAIYRYIDLFYNSSEKYLDEFLKIVSITEIERILKENPTYRSVFLKMTKKEQININS